jgi:hypothetical protein
LAVSRFRPPKIPTPKIPSPPPIKVPIENSGPIFSGGGGGKQRIKETLERLKAKNKAAASGE